nr:MAG TPA: hypothetical protein [Caudoviricetes sp.]
MPASIVEPEDKVKIRCPSLLIDAAVIDTPYRPCSPFKDSTH